jgi:hypothetical protein
VLWHTPGHANKGIDMAARLETDYDGPATTTFSPELLVAKEGRGFNRF